MAKYILAHDLGTSGDKASLFTTDGQFVATKTVGYETRYSNGNWAEQDPEDWWRAFCEATKAVTQGVDAKDILCAAFDGTFPNCLCVDEQGRAVYPAIMWQDARSADECEELTGMLREDLLGSFPRKPNGAMMERTLTRLYWIKKHLPEVFQKTAKVLPAAQNYLLMKMTGKAACDYANGRSTGMLNKEGTDWEDEILAAAGFPRSMMPELCDRTAIVGEVPEALSAQCGLAAGTKLVCGTGDTGCTSIGAGLLEPGDAYMNGGTSAGIIIKPYADRPVRGGLTASSGSSFSWLKNEICKYEQMLAEQTGRDVYDIINEQIASAPIGSNGVMFHPYLAGERAPRNNPKAKGSFVGISLTTKREDMLRSVIEGIGFNLNVILQRVRDAGYPVPRLLIVGGLGKGAITRQIFADIMNVELHTLKYMDETATVGCAVLGGMALGIYENERAVEKFMEISAVTKPIPENVAKYEPLKPIFEKIYQGLEPVYPDLF